MKAHAKSKRGNVRWICQQHEHVGILVFIPDFSGKCPDFSAKRNFFRVSMYLQKKLRFAEKSGHFPEKSWKYMETGTSDLTSRTSDRDLSYPRNVPMLILYTEIWRRGSFGRPRKST
jgi:hypothetical protein